MGTEPTAPAAPGSAPRPPTAPRRATRSMLPIADAVWLLAESSAMPLQVGGLNLFTLPDGVKPAGWIADQVAILRDAGDLRRPFSDVLVAGGRFPPLAVRRDTHIDMEHHVRTAGLTASGGRRALDEFVGREHAVRLDRARPLWELTVVSGLPRRQVATYLKIHHALMDGAASLHFTHSMMSTDPAERRGWSPMSNAAFDAYRSRLRAARPSALVAAPPAPRDLAAVADALRQQWQAGTGFSRALARYVGGLAGLGGLTTPWTGVPRTPVNRRISAARRFVSHSWDLERVRRVGKAFDGTINDAVLAMCGGAMRTYLSTRGQLPDRSLKATAPVSTRLPGDVDAGNSVSAITVSLGTDIADPAGRMAAIQRSARSAKEHLAALTPRQVQLYTGIAQFPWILAELAGAGGHAPMSNMTVSNIPGPREQLYWNGARLDGIFPAAMPFHGMALSLTQVSTNQHLDFGIIACRRSVPDADLLVGHLDDALAELEAAAGVA